MCILHGIGTTWYLMSVQLVQDLKQLQTQTWDNRRAETLEQLDSTRMQYWLIIYYRKSDKCRQRLPKPYFSRTTPNFNSFSLECTFWLRFDWLKILWYNDCACVDRLVNINQRGVGECHLNKQHWQTDSLPRFIFRQTTHQWTVICNRNIILINTQKFSS